MLVSTYEWKAEQNNARSKEIRAAAISRVESWRRLERFPLASFRLFFGPVLRISFQIFIEFLKSPSHGNGKPHPFEFLGYQFQGINADDFPISGNQRPSAVSKVYLGVRSDVIIVISGYDPGGYRITNSKGTSDGKDPHSLNELVLCA